MEKYDLTIQGGVAERGNETKRNKIDLNEMK